MKLEKINPKRLFRNKKNSHVSRSNPSSFGSGTSSSSDSSSSIHKSGADVVRTPTSVLPSHEISEEWPDNSCDMFFELEQAFKLIDRDGDGKIPRSQLETLLSRVGADHPPSEEELTTMLTEIDLDGDGSISLQEFGAISSAFRPACGSELRDAFNFFDRDQDGKITAQELFGVFTTIGDDRCTLEDCRRMIESVDKNGDGFVCFEDFTRMMEQQS